MSVEVATAQAVPDAGAGLPQGASVPFPNPAANPRAPDLSDARWQPVLGLPCQLTLDLPLPNFKVADILKLRVGTVIGTSWHVSRDVPLRINGTLIGWSEFEVVGTRLAARVTELA